MVERGELLRIGWGYYAAADLAELIPALPTGHLLLSAAAAAAALGPAAVVSHQTAALLHGLSSDRRRPGCQSPARQHPGAGPASLASASAAPPCELSTSDGGWGFP